MKRALEAIMAGTEDQIEYLNRYHRPIPEGPFNLSLEYDEDARYAYPAREKLIRSVACCALQKDNERELTE